MALNKQKISLPLSMGLETKIDEKQQPIGTLKVLENAVFDEPGKLKKRFGYNSVNLDTIEQSSISNAKALSKFRNELLVFNNDTMYSYASTLDKWANKGLSFTGTSESTQVLREDIEQSNINSIHVEGLNVFTYHDANGVHYSVIDNNSKAVLVNKRTISSTAKNAKVVNRFNEVYITYIEEKDEDSVRYVKFNIFDFNNITTPIRLFTPRNNLYDITLLDDRIYFAYSEGEDDGVLSVISLLPNDNLSSFIELSGETNFKAVNLESDSSNRLILSFATETEVKVIVFNYQISTALIPLTVVETIGNVENITTAETEDNIFTVLYEVKKDLSKDHYINQSTVDINGSVTNNGTIARSLGLLSHIFKSNGTSFFAAIHSNTLQSTVFILNTDGKVVSKIQSSTAGDLITNSMLTNATLISNDKFLIGTQIKGRLSQESGTFFSILGVNSVELDLDISKQPKTVSLGENLHITGGYLKMYDGSQIVEHGFHLYPEGVETFSANADDGVLEKGNYQYKALYRWIDARGIEHRSAPSIGFNKYLDEGENPSALTINLTTQIKVENTIKGVSENGNTIQYVVTETALTDDEVNITVTGTKAAIVITINQNDGTNNLAVPVRFTTAQFVQLLTEKFISGFNVTLIDSSSLLEVLLFSGGDDEIILDAGVLEQTVTLADGNLGGTLAFGSTVNLTTQIRFEATTIGNAKNDSLILININPLEDILNSDRVQIDVSGTSDDTRINVTPNSGLKSGSWANGKVFLEPGSELTVRTTTQGASANGKTMQVIIRGMSNTTDPNSPDWYIPHQQGNHYNPDKDVSGYNHMLFTNSAIGIVVQGTKDNPILVICVSTIYNVPKTIDAEFVNFVINSIYENKTIGYTYGPNPSDNENFAKVSVFGSTESQSTPSFLNDFTSTKSGTNDLINQNKSTTLLGGVNSTPTTMTTEQLVELVNTKAVSGINTGLNDPDSLLDLLSATGGDSTTMTHSGEADLESLKLAGGREEGFSQSHEISIPTLRVTDKENVTVELYRTEKDGTILYKVGSTPNDVLLDEVVIKDNVITDEVLISQEVLYTTGDVLDNLPAPSNSIMAIFKNRIVLTTPESTKLNYSKIRFEGFPVEFNDSLEQVIPDEGGDNVALQILNDKLIIFKKNAIYYMSGDGPNNLGEQDTFIEPELISSEIGCTNINSVVQTPLGIFFKSNKGIYLLSASLQLAYIGSSVEDFNNLTISSAIVVADKNQVRFTTTNGNCLVFNYIQQKWTTFSNHKALSAVLVNNEYHYLRSDNLLYKESTDYNDNGSSIKLKMESGWLSFNGVQGFQRVYRMLLLGDFKSNHKLRIKVAYNYIDTYTQEVIVDSSDFINSSTYGSESPYGSEITYGASNLYQIRLDFARQKCQSIKVSIEDIQADSGEALQLSNALFVVGTKSPDAKIDKSNGYGTK